MTPAEAFYFVAGFLGGTGLASFIWHAHLDRLRSDLNRIVAMAKAKDAVTWYRGIVHPGMAATVLHGPDATIISNKGDVPVAYTISLLNPDGTDTH